MCLTSDSEVRALLQELQELGVTLFLEPPARTHSPLTADPGVEGAVTELQFELLATCARRARRSSTTPRKIAPICVPRRPPPRKRRGKDGATHPNAPGDAIKGDALVNDPDAITALT